MDSEPGAPHQTTVTAPAVLIVEQDFMRRWRAADYLRERGYHIVEATGVSDAVTLLASGIDVDIVFFDLHDGDPSDGQVLAEWLENHDPRLPLLMTSKAAVEATTSASGYTHRIIVEPYELAQLAAHLDSILKGS